MDDVTHVVSKYVPCDTQECLCSTTCVAIGIANHRNHCRASLFIESVERGLGCEIPIPHHSRDEELRLEAVVCTRNTSCTT